MPEPWWVKPPVEEKPRGPAELLGAGLEKVSKGFDWINKNIDQPFASTIWYGLSKTLPGTQPGEREWDALARKGVMPWDQRAVDVYRGLPEPEFDAFGRKWSVPVKGITELADPLWWLPWTRAIGLAGKAALPALKMTPGLAPIGRSVSASRLGRGTAKAFEEAPQSIVRNLPLNVDDALLAARPLYKTDDEFLRALAGNTLADGTERVIAERGAYTKRAFDYMVEHRGKLDWDSYLKLSEGGVPLSEIAQLAGQELKTPIAGSLGVKEVGRGPVSQFFGEIYSWWRSSVLYTPSFVLQNLVEDPFRVFNATGRSFYRTLSHSADAALGRPAAFRSQSISFTNRLRGDRSAVDTVRRLSSEIDTTNANIILAKRAGKTALAERLTARIGNMQTELAQVKRLGMVGGGGEGATLATLGRSRPFQASFEAGAQALHAPKAWGTAGANLTSAPAASMDAWMLTSIFDTARPQYLKALSKGRPALAAYSKALDGVLTPELQARLMGEGMSEAAVKDAFAAIRNSGPKAGPKLAEIMGDAAYHELGDNTGKVVPGVVWNKHIDKVRLEADRAAITGDYAKIDETIASMKADFSAHSKEFMREYAAARAETLEQVLKDLPAEAQAEIRQAAQGVSDYLGPEYEKQVMDMVREQFPREERFFEGMFLNREQTQLVANLHAAQLAQLYGADKEAYRALLTKSNAVKPTLDRKYLNARDGLLLDTRRLSSKRKIETGDITPPVSREPAPTPIARPPEEPWQRTRADILAQAEREFPTRKAEQPGYFKKVRAWHKREVQRALTEGKAIPSEVLADYPDLAKIAPTKVVTLGHGWYDDAIAEKLKVGTEWVMPSGERVKIKTPQTPDDSTAVVVTFLTGKDKGNSFRLSYASIVSPETRTQWLKEYQQKFRPPGAPPIEPPGVPALQEPFIGANPETWNGFIDKWSPTFPELGQFLVKDGPNRSSLWGAYKAATSAHFKRRIEELAKELNVEAFLGKGVDNEQFYNRVSQEIDQLGQQARKYASLTPGASTKELKGQLAILSEKHGAAEIEHAAINAKATRLAEQKAYATAGNYAVNTNLDEFMRNIFPFWYFPSRSIPYYLKTFANKPYELAALHRATNIGRTEDAPQAMLGYIPVPGIPGAYVNPFRPWMGYQIMGREPFAGAGEPGPEQVKTALSMLGFSLGPQVSIPFSVANKVSESFGGPQLERGEARPLLPQEQYLQALTGAMGARAGMGLQSPTSELIYGESVPDWMERNVDKELAARGISPRLATKAERATAAQEVNKRRLLTVLLPGYRYRAPEELQRYKDIAGTLEAVGVDKERQQELRGMGLSPFSDLNRRQKRAIFESHPEWESWTGVMPAFMKPGERESWQTTQDFYKRWYSLRDRLDKAQEADSAMVVSGNMPKWVWKDRYQERASLRANSWEQLQSDYPTAVVTQEQYEVYAKMSGRNIAPIPQEDGALNEYYKIKPQPGIGGTMDWGKFFQERDDFLARQDPDIRHYIEAETSKAAEPDRPGYDSVEAEYIKSQPYLRAYQGVRDSLIRRYPGVKIWWDEYLMLNTKSPRAAATFRQRAPALQWLDSQERQIKERMRQSIPGLNQALTDWLGYQERS